MWEAQVPKWKGGKTGELGIGLGSSDSDPLTLVDFQYLLLRGS